MVGGGGGRWEVEETCLWLSRQLDKGAVTYMHLRYMYLVQADKYVVEAE